MFKMIGFLMKMNSSNNEDVGLENHNKTSARSTRPLHNQNYLVKSNYTEYETIEIFKK